MYLQDTLYIIKNKNKMYLLIQIKEINEETNIYSERLFKIINYHEIKKIDWIEWIELKKLWVQEIFFSDLEKLNWIFKQIKNTKKQLINNLKK